CPESTVNWWISLIPLCTALGVSSGISADGGGPDKTTELAGGEPPLFGINTRRSWMEWAASNGITPRNSSARFGFVGSLRSSRLTLRGGLRVISVQPAVLSSAELL